MTPISLWSCLHKSQILLRTQKCPNTLADLPQIICKPLETFSSSKTTKRAEHVFPPDGGGWSETREVATCTSWPSCSVSAGTRHKLDLKYIIICTLCEWFQVDHVYRFVCFPWPVQQWETLLQIVLLTLISLISLICWTQVRKCALPQQARKIVCGLTETNDHKSTEQLRKIHTQIKSIQVRLSKFYWEGGYVQLRVYRLRVQPTGLENSFEIRPRNASNSGLSFASGRHVHRFPNCSSAAIVRPTDRHRMSCSVWDEEEDWNQPLETRRSLGGNRAENDIGRHRNPRQLFPADHNVSFSFDRPVIKRWIGLQQISIQPKCHRSQQGYRSYWYWLFLRPSGNDTRSQFKR